MCGSNMPGKISFPPTSMIRRPSPTSAPISAMVSPSTARLPSMMPEGVTMRPFRRTRSCTGRLLPMRDRSGRRGRFGDLRIADIGDDGAELRLVLVVHGLGGELEGLLLLRRQRHELDAHCAR